MNKPTKLAHTTLSLSLALLAGACDPGSEEEDTGSASIAPAAYVVAFSSPGEAWDHSVGGHEQAGIQGHGAYFAGLVQSNELLMSGPFDDDEGGMAIFNVATVKEAQALLDQDPMFQSGHLQFELRPWQLQMSAL